MLEIIALISVMGNVSYITQYRIKQYYSGSERYTEPYQPLPDKYGISSFAKSGMNQGLMRTTMAARGFTAPKWM